MIAAVAAGLFGMLQMYLLSLFTANITGGNSIKAVCFLLLKVILYGATALLIVFLFRFAVVYCAIGYAVGLPIFAIAFFLIKNVKNKNKKGDSSFETIDNN